MSKRLIGTFFELGGRGAVEALSRTGLDYVIFDTEHGPFSVETVADCIVAAENGHLLPYVRIGDISRPSILRMLDIGARGLIIPNIHTVDEVKEIISCAKFAPVGNRGFCPNRTTGWGADEWAQDILSYMDKCNERCKVIPQCETKEALEHIEEIVALDGVDGIFVGPCDLSIDLGIPLQFDHPELLAAIQKILDTCKKYHKETYIYAGNPADAEKWFTLGYDAVAYSFDASLLITAYKNLIAQLRPE